MNKTATTVAAFLLGAAAGAAGAWYILKDRYAQIAQEEIDSVKEAFSHRAESVKADTDDSDISDEDEPEEPTRATDMMKNKSEKLIEKLDYTSYSEKPDISEVVRQRIEPEAKEDDVKEDRPYVIRPDEFGEFEDYEQISLTFYSDQIITDDNDDILEDVDRVIGFDSLNHFGEYEDDSVYVRNDRLKCDYEILLDQRTYEDVLKTKPHRKGVL